MGEMKVFTVRVPTELKDQLDELADDMDRSRSWIVNKALEDYVRYNTWFIKQVRIGIEQADRGEFATPGEVQAIVDKWKRAR